MKKGFPSFVLKNNVPMRKKKAERRAESKIQDDAIKIKNKQHVRCTRNPMNPMVNTNTNF